MSGRVVDLRLGPRALQRLGGCLTAALLYQLGPEVTVSKGFRFEVCLARQDDSRPGKFALNAYGARAARLVPDRWGKRRLVLASRSKRAPGRKSGLRPRARPPTPATLSAAPT